MPLPIHNNHTAYWVLGKGIAKEFEEEPPRSFRTSQGKEMGYLLHSQWTGQRKERQGNLRHKDNVTSLLACFADFDSGTKPEQMQRIRSFLPPTAIVESGRVIMLIGSSLHHKAFLTLQRGHTLSVVSLTC